MKHVIVIETVDDVGSISTALREEIFDAVERLVATKIGMCVAYGRFNVDSAIAATHEMYGAPVWRGQ